MHKKIIFSFICCYKIIFTLPMLFANDEDMLFNEIITDKLSEAGYDTNFQFWGNGNLHTVCINQSITEDKDPNIIAYEGNIYLRYTNKFNGAAFGFETQTEQKSGLLKNGDPIFQTLYAFLETDYIGEFRAGFTNTAADQIGITGHKILTAYTGPDSSNFESFYTASAGTIINANCCADDSNALKIVWYSPVINGFSIASSFTFNGKYTNPFKSIHNTCGDLAPTLTYSNNTLSLASKYEYGSNNYFNAKISICGWIGKGQSGATSMKIHNIKAYQIGTILGYKNFKLAAGFINNGKSLLHTKYASKTVDIFDNERIYKIDDDDVGIRPGANAGKLYSIGTSYALQKLTFCAGYLKSTVKFAKNARAVANIITVGAEYTFNRTLSAYIEYNNIKTRTCAQAMAYKKACGLPYSADNRANIIIIGTKINF